MQFPKIAPEIFLLQLDFISRVNPNLQKLPLKYMGVFNGCVLITKVTAPKVVSYRKL